MFGLRAGADNDGKVCGIRVLGGFWGDGDFGVEQSDVDN